MSQPSFSIVIPTYQRKDTLCASLRAVDEMEYSGPVEVIVVVDGSTDGTADAAAAIPSQFKRTIVSQPNAGAAAARNHGASLAAHDILLFLDDDMIVRPDLLSAHARRHLTDADAVIGHIPLHPSSPDTFISRAVGAWAEERAALLGAGSELTLFDLLTGQLSVKRTIFEQLGGFDAQFTRNGKFGNEDIDFGVRLIQQSRLVFEPEAVSWQQYVVTPAAYFDQWHQAGQADVSFAAKHGDLGQGIFALHDAGTPLTRFVVRPISRLPFAKFASSRLALALLRLPIDPSSVAGKAVAMAAFMARDIGYWSGVARAGGIPESSKITVLCYHSLRDLSADKVLAPYGIPMDRFEAHLCDLERRGFYFARPDDVLASINGTAKLPRKSVLISFDDCYVELADAARDILAPRGVRSIAFAVSGLNSNTNEWDSEAGRTSLELIPKPRLSELESMGIEIGSHSSTHRELPKLDDPDLHRETAGASLRLSESGVRKPRFFAYPYGEFDPRSQKAVSASYAAAFGLKPGRVKPGADRFALPRIEILARDNRWRFFVKTTFPRVSHWLDRI